MIAPVRRACLTVCVYALVGCGSVLPTFGELTGRCGDVDVKLAQLSDVVSGPGELEELFGWKGQADPMLLGGTGFTWELDCRQAGEVSITHSVPIFPFATERPGYQVLIQGPDGRSYTPTESRRKRARS